MKAHHTIPMLTEEVVETYCGRCFAGLDPAEFDTCPKCGNPKPWLFAHEIDYARWARFAIEHDKTVASPRNERYVRPRN